MEQAFEDGWSEGVRVVTGEPRRIADTTADQRGHAMSHARPTARPPPARPRRATGPPRTGGRGGGPDPAVGAEEIPTVRNYVACDDVGKEADGTPPRAGEGVN